MLIPLIGACEIRTNKNKQKSQGPDSLESERVRAELSYPCAGGTLWPREAKVPRLVAPSHRLSAPFTPGHPDEKIGKQFMRGWWTCSQDSGCNIYEHKLYLESVL